jgi:hypothetical protein
MIRDIHVLRTTHQLTGSLWPFLGTSLQGIGRALLWGLVAFTCPAWAGWEAGDFQSLPTLVVPDLAQFVADASQIPHPIQGYVVPSQTRTAHFQALLDAVFSAVDTMLAGYPQSAAPWCDIATRRAPHAQYAILRLWDQTSQRYFLYLKDIAPAGPQEAYLLINPEPTRRLVLGVPHTRDSTDPQTFENYTAQEGARLFTTLGARALLINGAPRCASPLQSRCTGGTTTQCGPGTVSQPVTVADAAHVTTTFFYVAHRHFFQHDATLKIAQLHGKASGSAQAIVGDGTPIKKQAGAVSVVFAQALAGWSPGATRRRVPGDESTRRRVVRHAQCRRPAGQPSWRGYLPTGYHTSEWPISSH